MGLVYSTCRPGATVEGETLPPKLQLEAPRPTLLLDDQHLLGLVKDCMTTVEEIGPISDVDTGGYETPKAKKVLGPPSQGSELASADSTANGSISMNNGIRYPYCMGGSVHPENALKAKLEMRLKGYTDSEVRSWMNQAISHLLDSEKKIVRFLKAHENPQLLDLFVEHLYIVLTAASCRGTNSSEGGKMKVPAEGEQWGMAFLDGFKQWNRIIQHLVDINRAEQID